MFEGDNDSKLRNAAFRRFGSGHKEGNDEFGDIDVCKRSAWRDEGPHVCKNHPSTWHRSGSAGTGLS